MTARRDLAELERRGVAAPHARRRRAADDHPRTRTRSRAGSTSTPTTKARLAEEAVALLTPRETIFLDSSTTTYYVARRLVETGIAATVLTNCLPVMELLFNEGGPDAGGDRHRRHAAPAHALVRRPVRGAHGPGPLRRPAVPLVKGIAANGMLTDADAARGRAQAHDDRTGRRGRAARSTTPSSPCAG